MRKLLLFWARQWHNNQKNAAHLCAASKWGGANLTPHHPEADRSGLR
jgi:hypothetical protein